MRVLPRSTERISGKETSLRHKPSINDLQKGALPSSQSRGKDNIFPSFPPRQRHYRRSRGIIPNLFLDDAVRKAPSYMLGIADLSVPYHGYSRGSDYRYRPEKNSLFPILTAVNAPARFKLSCASYINQSFNNK
jgi:hypothetical protein